MATCLKCFNTLPQEKFRKTVRSFPVGDYRDVRLASLPYCVDCENVLKSLIIQSQNTSTPLEIEDDHLKGIVEKYYQMLVDEKHIEDNPHLQPLSADEVKEKMTMLKQKSAMIMSDGLDNTK